MNRSRRQPRNSLPPRREHPVEFGVRHKVHYTEFDPTPGKPRSLEEFFFFLNRKWMKKTKSEVFIGDRLRPAPRRQFAIYNDPERMGMTVLENRLISRFARVQRLRWHKDDIGRLGQDLRNAFAGIEVEPPMRDGFIEVKLTDVLRVGAPNSSEEGRKVALIPDQASPAAEYLLQENLIATEGLGSLLGFDYPYDEFSPKFTVGKIMRGATEKEVGACVEAARSLLPLTVQLHPVTFFEGERVF